MVVIKIGGEAVESAEAFGKFLSVLKENLPAAVVFGAGIQINGRLEEENISFEFYNGERITTHAMLDLIEDEFSRMAGRIAGLLGEIETEFVRGGKIFHCRRKSPHLGLVGEITSVNTDAVKNSRAQCVLVSPVGSDVRGGLLNVNADVSAAALARALKSGKMIYITKLGGVMDKDNKNVPLIDRKKAEEMISSGIISAGMISKVKSAVETIESGVGEVVIGETRITAG